MQWIAFSSTQLLVFEDQMKMEDEEIEGKDSDDIAEITAKLEKETFLFSQSLVDDESEQSGSAHSDEESAEERSEQRRKLDVYCRFVCSIGGSFDRFHDALSIAASWKIKQQRTWTATIRPNLRIGSDLQVPIAVYIRTESKSMPTLQTGLRSQSIDINEEPNVEGDRSDDAEEQSASKSATMMERRYLHVDPLDGTEIEVPQENRIRAFPFGSTDGGLMYVAVPDEAMQPALYTSSVAQCDIMFAMPTQAVMPHLKMGPCVFIASDPSPKRSPAQHCSEESPSKPIISSTNASRVAFHHLVSALRRAQKCWIMKMERPARTQSKSAFSTAPS